MALYKQTYVARYGLTTLSGDAVIAGAITASGSLTSGGSGTFTGDGFFLGNGGVKVSSGTTAQRPTTNLSAGLIRYNSDILGYEGYFGSALGWGSLANTTVQALDKRNNLSDVTDVVASRTNLGVYSTAQIDSQATLYALKSNTYTTAQLYTQAQVNALLLQAAPPSQLAYFISNNPPTGWLKANGAAVSRTTYAALFAAIGTAYGAGDGSTTFNVVDARGEFLRGWDDGRGVDAGRVPGTFQAQMVLSHTHTAITDAQGNHVHTGITDNQGNHNHGGVVTAVGDHQHISPFGDQGITYPYGQVGNNDQVGSHGGQDGDNNWPYTSPTGAHQHAIPADGIHAHNLSINAAGLHGHNITVAATGGAENRPRNLAFLACIKY